MKSNHILKVKKPPIVPCHQSIQEFKIVSKFLFIITIALATNFTHNTAGLTHRYTLSTSIQDTLDSVPIDSIDHYSHSQPFSYRESSTRSTPPLTESLQFSEHDNGEAFYEDQDISNEVQWFTSRHDTSPQLQAHNLPIQPRSVLRRGRDLVPEDGDQASPAFNFPSVDPMLHNMQQDGVHPNDAPSEETNLLDWMEPGSGVGYDSQAVDRPEGSFAPTPSATPNSQMMTPIFEQIPLNQVGDSAPILVKRLPKLVGIAGAPWRYKIPPSTFQDEDGDLRYLRSTLIKRQFVRSEQPGQDENQDQSSANRLDWLVYDQGSQTLYGFPTEEDIGLNVFTLAVGDRWGLTSNETIKISIRPHQSLKSITHSIKITGNLIHQRRTPLPEILMDIVKNIAERVFGERSSKDIIVQSYSISNTSTDGTNDQNSHTLSMTWFNSSFPIQPCDLVGIETMFKMLLDERVPTPDWSLLNQANYDYSPSQALVKSLSPNFRPSSVRISLLGACEVRKSGDSKLRAAGSQNIGLRVKARLGKMQWKLGQPISYRIPQDIFIADDGSRTTRNLSLNLYTIDGKTLDRDPLYSFLEFDQETQTIFGLSYDLGRHVGSKELLLVARHPVTDERIRETFIIEIEPQDLTTINNRAFRVSLYFMTRVNIFGPREQVMVSRRMVTALDITDLSYGYQEYIDFAVIDIQKFMINSYSDSSSSLSDPANSWKYQDKIFPMDDTLSTRGYETYNSHDGSSGEGAVLYKLTWTNETIGYRGDCPVEVIKENILYTLECTMMDYIPPGEQSRVEESFKNDSMKFYERLKEFFEPAIDLIHLRFEPMNACVEALELHDVGNSDFADIVDKAENLESITEAPLHAILAKPIEAPKVKEISPINSDEYWAIVVLIILVVAIFFVVMMLIMGLHTYRINQEKRFELQMKLAQARQNSMYLSSMVLADQLQPSDLVGQQSNLVKPVYMDERSLRKPVVLDDDQSHLLANGSPYYKPMAVKLTGHTVETMPLKSGMTFTMDSIANMQNNGGIYPETIMANQQMFTDERQRSMTLNRRAINHVSRPMASQASSNHLSHSQSIITVTSAAPPLSLMPHSQATNMPFVYAPMPVFYESSTTTTTKQQPPSQPPCEL